MLHRYANNLQDMPVDDFIDTVRAGREKEQEERAWQLWVSLYPLMHMPEKGIIPGIKFLPFSEFLKKQINPAKVSQRSAEEILKDAADIRKRLGR